MSVGRWRESVTRRHSCANVYKKNPITQQPDELKQEIHKVYQRLHRNIYMVLSYVYY